MINSLVTIESSFLLPIKSAIILSKTTNTLRFHKHLEYHLSIQ